MREFTVGDIHGCAQSLRALVQILHLEKSDTIVFLGDYIDRGPDSCAVIDTILELGRTCTVIALCGNHEKMLLQSRSDSSARAEWLKQGGQATLESYAQHGFGRNIEAIPERHWNFLEEQTLDYWETDDHIFVHASIDPNLAMRDQPDFLLFWQRFTDPTKHESGKQIICGHTGQKSGWPAVFEGGICIDTFAFGGGWLTCFETGSQTFIQTNERNESRTFDRDLLRHK